MSASASGGRGVCDAERRELCHRLARQEFFVTVGLAALQVLWAIGVVMAVIFG